MHKSLYTLTFICFLSFISIGQEYGDTLYVIAYNGVNIRSQPEASSEKVGAVPLGTPLMYCSDSHDDRFEVRNGRWIEVEYNYQSCYVFDGFLTDKKPPSSRKLTLTQLDSYIKEAYGKSLTHEVVEKSQDKGDREDKKVSHFSSGLTVTYRLNSTTELWEYAFPKLRSRDLINIIDLAYSNYNTEEKTLVSHFKESKFWKNTDPDDICPSAFPVQISDKIRIQYDYSRKRMDVDPIPKIIIIKQNQ